jgi:ribosomal protein S18 acetylase RimI-like enzyme
MVTVEYISDPASYGDEIRRLLAAADEEFVPPLSAREGTTQTEGLSEQRNDALNEYYEQCIDQSFILAHGGETVYGFLSFRQGYDIEELGQYTPSTYVSTIIVDPTARREGHARAMYRELLTNLPAEIRDQYVTTRTWSTNDRHLSLLDDLGFELLKRVKDDRGDGIDTVYYGIEVEQFDG